jgi:hypothetical protein
MNATPARNPLERRGPAIGNLSRDILCLIWVRGGLTSAQVAAAFNIEHATVTVQKHIDGLARKGLLAYLRDPQGWTILDTEATRAAFSRSPFKDGWVRLLSDDTLHSDSTNTYALARQRATEPPQQHGLRVAESLSPEALAINIAQVQQQNKKYAKPKPEAAAAAAAAGPEHTPQLTGERARIAHFALPSQGGVVIRAGALDALRLQARRHSPGADPAAYLGLRD